MPQLIITAETGESTSLGLSEDTVTIGRRRDNSLCLPHLSVSGYHAEVISDAGCPIIQDLQSTNGTVVNGRKIHRHFLLHSDEIAIGTYKLQYSETFTSTPPQPEDMKNVMPMKPVAPIVEPQMEQIISEVAALRVASGAKSGSMLPLEKPLTTVGKSGGDIGAIAKKETGYYFLPMSAHSQPIKHNGKGVTPRIEIKLAGGDFIEIGGEYLEFVFPYYNR
ncbi:MAG: FHA domain-containing protein [Pseudomonadota bacterium]